jgi:hypothetical protein
MFEVFEWLSELQQYILNFKVDFQCWDMMWWHVCCYLQKLG